MEGTEQKSATVGPASADLKETPPETGPQTQQVNARDKLPEDQQEARPEPVAVQLDREQDLQPTASAAADGKMLGFAPGPVSSVKAALPEHFLTAPDDPGPETTNAQAPAPPRKRGLFG